MLAEEFAIINFTIGTCWFSLQEDDVPLCSIFILPLGVCLAFPAESGSGKTRSGQSFACNYE